MVTISIDITEAEFMAIALVGSEEMRTVKQQVRYLVAQDMIRRGLLKPEDLHDYAETLNNYVSLVSSFFPSTETTQQEYPSDFVDGLPDSLPVEEWREKEERLSEVLSGQDSLEEAIDRGIGEEIYRDDRPLPVIPSRYRGGKESIHWKVFNLFAQSPNRMFTRSDVMEAMEMSDRQVASPIARLLGQSVIEVVSTTTGSTGRDVMVYRLTETAKQMTKERNDLIYGGK